MAEKLHIPEVIEPDEKLPRDLVALRKFAYLMDEALSIKGLPFKVGLDALIGLIPGVGDVVGGLMSTWIVIGALRHRVPARIILRMILNIVVDLFFGAVPLAGDVFDFLYEENVMNMRLLEKHRDRSRPPRSMAAIAFVATLVVLFILGIAIGIVVALGFLIFWLIGDRPVL